MKNILFIFLIITNSVIAQKQLVNTKKDYAANGYDVVAYFNSNAIEGNKEFTHSYKGVKYKFSSKNNLELFVKNPLKFLPEYGGYCAYAIGKKGKKVSINPETFEIRDGKLYLFYNKGRTNTLDLWLKEGADELKVKADKNWKKISQ